MKPKDIKIPVRYLRECFIYDPLTGRLTWKNRPEHHFSTPRAHKAWADRCLGQPAFTKKATNGYMEGNLRFEGRRYYLLAHRVAWAIETGAWPDDEIDHRNRRRADNRFINLRPSTRSLNGYNRRFKSNATGLTGVQDTGYGTYSAKIREKRKRVYLGTFQTAEAAHAAYLQAAKNIHGEDGRAE